MNQNSFDENINERLSDHESPLPEDMFERILRERANRLTEEHDASLRERLDNHVSIVPSNFFDRIADERDNNQRLEEAQDANLRERLDNHVSLVPSNLFDRIAGELDKKHHFEEAQDANLRDRLDNHISVVPSNLFDSISIERDTRITNDDLHPTVGEKLANFESAVPSDMFDRIMDERDKRKPLVAWWQSPRFRWAIAASVLLLVATMFAYQKGQLATDNGQLTEDSVQRTMDNGQSGIVTPNVNTEKKADNAQNAQITEGGKISDLDSKISDTALKSSQNSKTENAVVRPTTQYANRNTKGANNNTAYSLPITKAASNSTIITSNLTKQNFIQDDGTSGSIPTKTPQLDYNPMLYSNNPETNIRSVIVVNPLNGLITGGVATSPLSHDKLKLAMPCLGPDAGCPTFGPTGMRKAFFIDAYGAPEMSFRRLKAISNEFLDYRNARDTTERTFTGYSAGLRASMVFDNGISIRAGAVYAQKNERFRRDSAVQGNITWTIVQRPNGTRDTLSADIETAVLRQTRYNRYRTIDFTIQLGYELPIADRLTVGINAGANINLYNNIKATILGKDLQGFPVSASNTIYNNSVGVSLVGSVAGYYDLTDRIQLMVEPQFRHYLRPLTKNPEYQLQQSYNQLGLAVGVRFKLTRTGLKVL
jgi:hypothetical protein